MSCPGSPKNSLDTLPAEILTHICDLTLRHHNLGPEVCCANAAKLLAFSQISARVRACTQNAPLLWTRIAWPMPKYLLSRCLAFSKDAPLSVWLDELQFEWAMGGDPLLFSWETCSWDECFAKISSTIPRWRILDANFLTDEPLQDLLLAGLTRVPVRLEKIRMSFHPTHPPPSTATHRDFYECTWSTPKLVEFDCANILPVPRQYPEDAFIKLDITGSDYDHKQEEPMPWILPHTFPVLIQAVSMIRFEIAAPLFLTDADAGIPIIPERLTIPNACRASLWFPSFFELTDERHLMSPSTVTKLRFPHLRSICLSFNSPEPQLTDSGPMTRGLLAVLPGMPCLAELAIESNVGVVLEDFLNAAVAPALELFNISNSPVKSNVVGQQVPMHGDQDNTDGIIATSRWLALPPRLRQVSFYCVAFAQVAEMDIVESIFQALLSAEEQSWSRFEKLVVYGLEHSSEDIQAYSRRFGEEALSKIYFDQMPLKLLQ